MGSLKTKFRWCSILILLALATIASASAAPATRAATPAGERMLQETERILSAARKTKYNHSTIVDESRGSFELDCSGLVCYALKRISPDHLKLIPVARGHRRQLASDFEEAFAKAGANATSGWRKVERLADARAGDVIAWKVLELKPGGSTGHTIVIDERPREMGGGVLAVTVIDSTTKPHANDTRKPGENGIGRGTLYFTVDKEGRPISYNGTSPKGKMNALPITIGRAMGE
jgi:hypothetical protein